MDRKRKNRSTRQKKLKERFTHPEVVDYFPRTNGEGGEDFMFNRAPVLKKNGGEVMMGGLK